MVKAAPSRPFSNQLLVVVLSLSVLGFATLVLMLALGFEEPSSVLLLTSFLLVFSCPVAVLLHVFATRQLSRDEKIIWIREFTGRRFIDAFHAYLTSGDRSASAKQRARAAKGRGSAPPLVPGPPIASTKRRR
jgi:hypothetical protein